MGKVLARLAVLAAAVGAVVFFWRKRHPSENPVEAVQTAVSDAADDAADLLTE
jgi:hypothetical protein